MDNEYVCECVRLELFSSTNYDLYKIKIHIDFASVSLFFITQNTLATIWGWLGLIGYNVRFAAISGLGNSHQLQSRAAMATGAK